MGYYYSVAWNWSYWVAVGSGDTNTVAYSYNGTDWVTTTYLYGKSITWNGSYCIVVGYGQISENKTSIFYSKMVKIGKNWYGHILQLVMVLNRRQI